MYSITANRQRNYGIKSYTVNTLADIDAIPIFLSSTAPGSIVLVIDTGEKYILNRNRQWELLTTLPGASGDGPEQIVYEGGDLANNIDSIDISYDGGDLD